MLPVLIQSDIFGKNVTENETITLQINPEPR